MAAALSVRIVDAAPGNVVTIPGSGLTPGANATVKLAGQGVTAQPNLTPATITIPALFAADGSSVALTIPDGVMSGTLTVTANDLTTATCALRAVSQYAQESEYIGEGEDTSTLAPGELDAILRRASSAIDAFLGDSLRLLQRLERHRYRPQPNGAPRIYPFRSRGRSCPIVSVDQLTFVSASDLVTVFNTGDMYVNEDLNYVEILAYAIGNYALLGELQTIGYSANVIELSYTSGYGYAQYPQALRDATVITATSFLNRRRRQSMGLGPFAKFEGEVVIDQVGVRIPDDAKRMLRPFAATSLA